MIRLWLRRKINHPPPYHLNSNGRLNYCGNFLRKISLRRNVSNWPFRDRRHHELNSVRPASDAEGVTPRTSAKSALPNGLRRSDLSHWTRGLKRDLPRLEARNPLVCRARNFGLDDQVTRFQIDHPCIRSIGPTCSPSRCLRHTLHRRLAQLSDRSSAQSNFDAGSMFRRRNRSTTCHPYLLA